MIVYTLPIDPQDDTWLLIVGGIYGHYFKECGHGWHFDVFYFA